MKKPNERKKTLFWSLACLFFATVSLYVYLVNAAAWNGVGWRDAAEETAALSGRVAELESHYLSLQQGVTLKAAYARGFEDARFVRFISARKVGAVATANEI